MHWHKLVFDVSLAEIVCFNHVFVGLVAEIVFCVSEALIGVTQNTPGSGPRTPQSGGRVGVGGRKRGAAGNTFTQRNEARA